MVQVAEQFYKCITHPADKTGSVCERLYTFKIDAVSQERGESHKLYLEGSNPSTATKFCLVNSAVRVAPLHGEGRRFDPVTRYQNSECRSAW